MSYGTFLAKAIDGILLSYRTYGSYQGDYIAIIEKNTDWHIYKGAYGSCSGCDWLESADTVEEGIIAPEEVASYLKSNPPFLVIPKAQLPETIDELKALLPANTRVYKIEEDKYVDVLPFLFDQLEHPNFDNLRYLEQKYKEKEI